MGCNSSSKPFALVATDAVSQPTSSWFVMITYQQARLPLMIEKNDLRPHIWFPILACFTRLWRHWMPRFKKLRRRKPRQSSCNILRFSGWLSGFTTSLLSMHEWFMQPLAISCFLPTIEMWFQDMTFKQESHLGPHQYLSGPVRVFVGPVEYFWDQSQRIRDPNSITTLACLKIRSVQAHQFQLSLPVEHQEKESLC